MLFLLQVSLCSCPSESVFPEWPSYTHFWSCPSPLSSPHGPSAWSAGRPSFSAQSSNSLISRLPPPTSVIPVPQSAPCELFMAIYITLSWNQRLLFTPTYAILAPFVFPEDFYPPLRLGLNLLCEGKYRTISSGRKNPFHLWAFPVTWTSLSFPTFHLY